MKVNISYSESLKFEQFKKQFQHHFTIFTPAKKESEMKIAWEKAEAKIKSKPGTNGPEKIIEPAADQWEEIENTEQPQRNRSE